MLTLPTTAQNIIDAIQKNGLEAYAVGGAVRDLIMERSTHGWDFTSNATPEQILKIFENSFYDNQFGTVGVKIYDKTSKANDKPIDIYEITTYRSEKGYSDFRHPDQIQWGKSLEEDLARRDFTIDAIAFDGKIIVDPFDGRGDLKKRVVRSVGNPGIRFNEDALRMMRAIRIASQLGFMIDSDTLTAIRTYGLNLSKIAVERIQVELFKLLESPFAADGILLMKNTGLLSVLLPEFEETFSVNQKSPKRHHIYDVGTHSVMALKHCPSTDAIVRLATLLHDIGKPKTVKEDAGGIITFYNHEVVGARMVREIAKRLRFSKKDSDKLYTLVRWHQFSVDERQTDSAIRRIIRRIEKDNLTDMLALRTGDRLGGGAVETSWRLELFKKRLEEVQKQPFTVNDLKINGYDVMKELNCKPGPVVGNVLHRIFSEVESGKLANSREDLLKQLVTLKSEINFRTIR